MLIIKRYKNIREELIDRTITSRKILFPFNLPSVKKADSKLRAPCVFSELYVCRA